MLDLIGKKFGKLTVLRKAEPQNGRVRWECQCECGNLHYVLTSNLTSGHVTRCSQCSSKVNDLTGKVFGQLTVIKKNDNYRQEHNIKNTHAYWDCLCTCGNIVTVKSSDLLAKQTSKCPECANNQFIDETGNRYGYLTIVEYLGRKNRNSLWLAKCDCGKQCEVLVSDIKRGKGKLSCGCKSIKSKGELLITNILEKNHISYQYQFTFDDLIGKQNIKLPYDFAIFDDNNIPIRLIEFDGEQHYKSFEYFGGEEIYKRRQELDKMKNQYAKDKNIPLVRIPYNQLGKITIDMILGDEYLI